MKDTQVMNVVTKVFNISNAPDPVMVLAGGRWLVAETKKEKFFSEAKSAQKTAMGGFINQSAAMKDKAMMCEIFLAWKSAVAQARVEASYADSRAQVCSAVAALLGNNQSDNMILKSMVARWAQILLDKKKNAKKDANNEILRKLLQAGAEAELQALVRSVLHAWSRCVMQKAFAHSAQTTKVLSFWAGTQVLARMAMQQWHLIVVAQKEAKAEMDRVGNQKLAAARNIALKIGVHSDSELMAAVMRAWFEAFLATGKSHRMAAAEQLAAATRQAVMGPAEKAVAKMFSNNKTVCMQSAWHAWEACVTASKKEKFQAKYTGQITGMQARTENLVGLALLIWAQEKTLAFARLTLIAWSRAATANGRNADVAALASDREMTESAVDSERQRRRDDVSYLLGRAFVDQDLNLYQVCFLEWKINSGSARGTRGKEELQYRELVAHERIEMFVQNA